MILEPMQGDRTIKDHLHRKIVKDCVGTMKVVLTLEDGFNLIVVGRYHAPDSIPT